MPRSLIAFVGFKGSGKNTAAATLTGHQSISFADALKDILATLFHWPRDLLEGNTLEGREWREQIDPWWSEKLRFPNFTPRFAMTHIASDVMRQFFHPDIWMLNVERRFMQSPDASIVVPDCRFPNEIALIRAYGGKIIRVKRGPDPDWYDLANTANTHPEMMLREYFVRSLKQRGVHESEYAWIGSPVDATVHNDGSLLTLQIGVKEAVTAAYASR